MLGTACTSCIPYTYMMAGATLGGARGNTYMTAGAPVSQQDMKDDVNVGTPVIPYASPLGL